MKSFIQVKLTPMDGEDRDREDTEVDGKRFLIHLRQSPPDPSSPVWSAHGARAGI